jgi:NADPH-dependent 2,4-dienoyl-CoA reductase/sulfur reductase-like enzyme
MTMRCGGKTGQSRHPDEGGRMTTKHQTSPVVDRDGNTTPVLIVGGGLTGLSTALFLAWHGVRPLLVERHPDLLIHP